MAQRLNRISQKGLNSRTVRLHLRTVSNSWLSRAIHLSDLPNEILANIVKYCYLTATLEGSWLSFSRASHGCWCETFDVRPIALSCRQMYGISSHALHHAGPVQARRTQIHHLMVVMDAQGLVEMGVTVYGDEVFLA